MGVGTLLVGPSAPILASRPPEARAEPRADVQEAVEGFEALWAGMLVREVLEPGREGGLLGKGPGHGVLSGMVEEVLAKQWAQAGGLGLTDALERSLGGSPATPPREGEGS